VSNNYVFQRGAAFFGPDNDYLTKLLDKEGLSKFLKPTNQITDQVEPAGKQFAPAATSRTLLAHFSIERNLICIRCALALTKSADYDPSPTVVELHLPSYDPTAKPPSITKELSNHEFPSPSRISELTQTLWRVFCQNDLLTLHVEAKLHPDGSMSFSRCSANVDESAVHRQAELFSHIKRDEHPDEIEAEKSLLVYRKY
jgi:hypothetical protein